MKEKISVKEKIAYALGDASANIAWRGVSTFLAIFYTDVFGLTPATVAILLLVVRFGDGVSDVVMGVIGDRTKSKYGHFRPWVLWTAVPLGVILSLLFTSPDWSMEWKIVYAFATYLLFTLIYTANNIPYGALMAVMTDDDKERTSIGSYRMAGAFAGGMLVQGALLYLVLHFGNINPDITILPVDEKTYAVTVSASQDVENVNINTKNGIALFKWNDASAADTTSTASKSFSMKADEPYSFIVTGEEQLEASQISIIDQQKGYSRSIYSLSVVLIICLLITFYFTRERVSPPKEQKGDLKQDLLDLIRNKPWLVILVVGLLFNVYNAMKQGTTLYYFTHYLHDQLLAASYMVGLMIVSIAGAMATAPLSRRIGKKNLFIAALLFSGAINSLLYFCGPQDTVMIFSIGLTSEFAAAIFPTLFFVMLGDAADYSEYVNGRRATGLVYSAGSFATKFGGGIAGAVIGWVLAVWGYNGQDAASIKEATPAIVMLMSWIPGLIAVITAGVMTLYPLSQEKMNEITPELIARRAKNKED